MTLFPMKQGFYKAMCTCIAMGVLNPKLNMSSNDKKMRVEVCCHSNKLFTAESHHVLLLSQETGVPNTQHGSCENISLLPW